MISERVIRTLLFLFQNIQFFITLLGFFLLVPFFTHKSLHTNDETSSDFILYLTSPNGETFYFAEMLLL
jgi:hypothetical protein